LLTGTPHPLGCGYSTLEFAMNIELEEVVVQDVSDDALEMAAGGAQGWRSDCYRGCSGSCASQSAGLC
jgi:hypothetical protein